MDALRHGLGRGLVGFVTRSRDQRFACVGASRTLALCPVRVADQISLASPAIRFGANFVFRHAASSSRCHCISEICLLPKPASTRDAHDIGSEIESGVRSFRQTPRPSPTSRETVSGAGGRSKCRQRPSRLDTTKGGARNDERRRRRRMNPGAKFRGANCGAEGSNSNHAEGFYSFNNQPAGKGGKWRNWNGRGAVLSIRRSSDPPPPRLAAWCC